MANPDSPQAPPPRRRPPRSRPASARLVNQPDPPSARARATATRCATTPSSTTARSSTSASACRTCSPLDKLEPELNNFNPLPSYSLIQPNLCNSGAEDPRFDQSEGGAARADDWLEQWVPKIQDTQAFKQGGLIVITFNETSLPTPNERVGTLLINRWLPRGPRTPPTTRIRC